jgi:hypothetical protein
MQGKVIFTLIVFLFPALIAPLFVLAFLTRLPGAFGSFFTDYSFAVLWGCYALLFAGGVFLYYFFKRRAARAALTDANAHDSADAEPRALLAESQQE